VFECAIELSGEWEFRLDPEDIGTNECWFNGSLPDRVRLPGSLDENGIGETNLVTSDLSGLSRKVKYTGVAWYSRVMILPSEWAGKTVVLNLERVHWFSECWVNGVALGSWDSLSVPHRYSFVVPASGSSTRLTIKIDNTPHIPIGRIGHALTDWTQTNWNGVIGGVTLKLSRAAFEGVRVVTDRKHVTVLGTALQAGIMNISLRQDDEQQDHEFRLDEVGPFCLILPAESIDPWSDKSPNLFQVDLAMNGAKVSVTTGRRWIACSGKQIVLNDLPIFLRGTLECCVFPLTAYPPTSIGEWMAAMTKAREFGLNHIRFHSWCPPDAAFCAADQVGIILQVELPVWTGLWPISSDIRLFDFCRREAHRILEQYGHHPSFAMFALGNEIAFYGSEPHVDELLEELRQLYFNRIYTFSAQGTHLSLACDYYVQADNGKPGPENRPLRGSTWFGVGSRFDRESPNTLVTCDEAAEQFDRPVISHEVAEWAVFPDVQNADRYRGVLEARNFTTIAEMLQRRGMLHQAPEFVAASGKLSSKLYKEEIESLLRTKGLAGYQLLGLTDFPGQGTATIGMLDAFWVEKGFISATEFRHFCAETVPLLAYSKVIWQLGEVFEAEALMFHAGDAQSVELNWRVLDYDGGDLLGGTLGIQELLPCHTTSYGKISFSTHGLGSPERYRIELFASNGVENAWDFWIYPKNLPQTPLTDVFVAPFYRQDVRDALKRGERVWLNMNPRRLWSGIPGRFAPAFWSPIHFKEQVGTMGTLIEANHPVFDQFPTEFHSDWQWWDVLTQSKAMVLNDLPNEFQPILQVIDRYERNDKLGTILEAQVGSGKVFITLIDFENLEDRPASRQLDHSIRAYLASDSFSPKQHLTLSQLDAAFRREP
jgi:hypothetical protein